MVLHLLALQKNNSSRKGLSLLFTHILKPHLCINSRSGSMVIGLGMGSLLFTLTGLLSSQLNSLTPPIFGLSSYELDKILDLFCVSFTTSLCKLWTKPYDNTQLLKRQLHYYNMMGVRTDTRSAPSHYAAHNTFIISCFPDEVTMSSDFHV